MFAMNLMESVKGMQYLKLLSYVTYDFSFVGIGLLPLAMRM